MALPDPPGTDDGPQVDIKLAVVFAASKRADVLAHALIPGKSGQRFKCGIQILDNSFGICNVNISENCSTAASSSFLSVSIF